MTGDPDALLAAAKDRFARAILGAPASVRTRLGRLTLRPHQVTAVSRLLEIIATYRGALLADAVGLGKTYVALAVAREHDHALIICPAALRTMWERASALADMDIPIASMESLSRGVIPDRRPDLIIIDEAHHLRSPGTQRYEAVAHLAHRARVLLVSATPLHNSRRDLISLLALFAGSRVKEWDDDAIARLVVRRDEHSAGQDLPAIAGPESLQPGADDDCLDAILALPPVVPAADEGVAHALATISLLHLWTSSRAALVASVRRRMARAMALRDAMASGHVPTSAELSAWRFADGALQLALPVVLTADHSGIEVGDLEARLDRFVERSRALLDVCHASRDPDEARVTLLRALRRRHPGERVVAFSQYAHTVTALGRLMRSDRGIAIVTADGARIASGAIAREEVLSQLAADAAPVHAAERIDIVLTTDLLSEGIDLRGASVIVHLDLPWNPARMEQRVGRSRRAGSPHRQIHVYAFVPPTAAERMLELRRRLESKVRAARNIVGGGFEPFGTMHNGCESPVEAGEVLRGCLQRWLLSVGDHEVRLAVGAVRAPVNGFLAAVRIGGLPRIVADLGAGISDDPSDCLTAVDMVGAGAPIVPRACSITLKRISEWIASRTAAGIAGGGAAPQRAVLERLTQAVSRAPRHRRSAIMAGAQRSRAVLTRLKGVGVERVLDELARSPVDDLAWLHALESFCDLRRGDAAPDGGADQIIAMILLSVSTSEEERDEALERVGATPG